MFNWTLCLFVKIFYKYDQLILYYLYMYKNNGIITFLPRNVLLYLYSLILYFIMHYLTNSMFFIIYLLCSKTNWKIFCKAESSNNKLNTKWLKNLGDLLTLNYPICAKEYKLTEWTKNRCFIKPTRKAI